MLRKFQGCFRIFKQVYFKKIPRSLKFQKSFHGVSIISDDSFKGDIRAFLRSCKGISKKLRKFHECFKEF